MLRLLWDASALAKRYALELGSQTVDALFAAVLLSQMTATFLGYAETFSLLTRKCNRGQISRATLRTAISLLQTETLNSLDFSLLTVHDADILTGVEYIQKHHINSSDAAILAAYLRYARLPGSPPCLLVASDQRLLRAASAEGLATLNPELLLPADVPGTLASL